MENLISWATTNRLVVILLALGIVVAGAFAVTHLPIDAVPDVTNVQVQVITASPTLSALEIERFITYPVEVAMTGIPKLEEVRSISRYGLSVVTVVFKDGTDIYWGRQQIAEKLAGVEIPEGLGRPALGPITSALGEIYHYTIDYDSTTRDPAAPYSNAELMDLRTTHDWAVRRRLLTTPGIVEVNSFGGQELQFQVLMDPVKLVSYDLTVRDVLDAVEGASRNAGGAFIEHAGEQYIVRGEGLVRGVEDIREAVVTSTPEGRPIHVHDVAEIVQGPGVRVGAVTRDGKGEAMVGIALMLMGENSRTAAANVRERVEELDKELRPQGYRIDAYYDRTELVERTITTVTTNLVEGGALVIVVLLLLLGNLRGGLVVASIIPLSMLFAFTPMYLLGLSGNLMSLGAIDFGMVVDGAVVMVENAIRRLSHRKPEEKQSSAREIIVSSAREVARPVVFAVAIIIIVYLPILSLTGMEGKMFRPMALTVVFALAGALFLTLTYVPALSTFVLKGPVSETEPWLMRKARGLYVPTLAWAMRNSRKTVIVAILAFLGAGAAFPFLGGEFLPKLDEGVVAIQSIRLPSVSLDQSVEMGAPVEKALLTLPEVKTVVSRIGAAELATDPMGPDITDIFVILKDKSEWRDGLTKEALVNEMRELLEQVPGMNFSFTQPIELRVNELITGARSDVALKIFGDDLGSLKEIGTSVVAALKGLEGAEDVRLEQTTGLPQLVVRFRRDLLARHGITIAEAAEALETAFGGTEAGEVFEGDRRFEVVVRLEQAARTRIEDVGRLMVHGRHGSHVPLMNVAEIRLEEGPAQISREWGSRRIGIEFNVRGRDIESVVKEAQERIARSVNLPTGYHLEWGGSFEQLDRARTRLIIVVPAGLALIYIMLFMTFGSLRQASLIFSGIPFAFVGGVAALALRGMPFSISAGVGFIALFGVAVMNGVVMLSHINRLREEGMGMEDAVREGAETRLRPVLMTALVAALGFIPMALSGGAGAEVQRPLATVVIGGLVSSTLLTLFVVPILYRRFAEKNEEVDI